MAIEGPLRELGIHDVFQLLDLSRKTGILKIASDLRQNSGTIYFDDGAIVYAEVLSNPHPLGGILVRAGKISDADFERARSVQMQRGVGRLGDILVEIGAISARELERQVRQQVEEVIFEIMGWQEGYFSFTEESLSHIPAEAQVRIPVEAILMEGARRIDEWSRIQRKIPHLAVIPTLAPPPETGAGSIDLLPPEWETLAAINGTGNVRELAQVLGIPEFEVAKTLFGLASTGIVEIVEPDILARENDQEEDQLEQILAATEEHLRNGEYEDARIAAELAARVKPHDARIHGLIGKVHLANGRPQQAAEEFRRSVRLDPAFAPGQRYLGIAYSALGKFADALDVWERWVLLVSNDPQESAKRPLVERAMEAAQTLDQAIRESSA